MCFSKTDLSSRTVTGFLQLEQVRLPASAGRKLTSLSQVRHCMSMTSAMKPLTLILLVSISCGAQTLVDAANQERARQAKLKSTRVFTDQNAHTIRPLVVPSADAKASTPAAPAAQARCASGCSALRPPENELLQKNRAKLRALEDQETAVKIQINDLTNQVYAPVTDQTTKDQALNKLGDAMTRPDRYPEGISIRPGSALQELEAKAAAAAAAAAKEVTLRDLNRGCTGSLKLPVNR
jgi:hypothetical protein